MQKKTSLKDIAQEVGVSIALVSYVLNGKNTKRINKETANKIKEIAEQLNYQPNQIAKSLKNSKTNTIGLVVADISNFFYSYIAGYIEEEANKYGYNVVFASAYENPDRFKNLLELMVSRQVDGLILAIPDGAEQTLKYIQQLSIPYVLIDREFPTYGEMNTVCLNNFRSTEIVVEKMVEIGCKKIVAFGLDSGLFHLNERNRGFVETGERLLGEGQVDLYKLEEVNLNTEIAVLLSNLLNADRPIDGICFFTNKIAMVALPLLLAMKVRIPEDLAIFCFDEVEAYQLFPYPMFYVRQPLKDMSIEAVQYLLDNKGVDNLGIRKFEAELIQMSGY